MNKIVTGAVLFMALASPLFATADVPSTSHRCVKAEKVREQVVKRHGKRAPGRDICKLGIIKKPRSERGNDLHPGVREPSWEKKRYYLNALRRLNAPLLTYVGVYAGKPLLPPADTMSATRYPTGVAGCIVDHESGGYPGAVNGQYHGIAQWSPEAWARMGGLKYASDPLGATYDEQLTVLNYGLVHYGCNDWCPFDGC